MKKRTVKMLPGNAAEGLRWILEMNNGQAVVTRTGYSAHAEAGGVKYLFGNHTPVRTFGAAQALRRDVWDRSEEIKGSASRLWGGEPGCDRRAPKYFMFSNEHPPASAVCVDIKAAYPSTLDLMGMASKKTVQALHSLPKTDRLKAVGMLATRRTVTTYRDYEAMDETVTEAPTAPAFFVVCKRVGDVMDAMAREAGAGFILFWVDGIFIYKEAAPRMVELLNDHGYRSTVAEVTDIQLSRSGKYMAYTKDGKRTYFCRPRKITLR